MDNSSDDSLFEDFVWVQMKGFCPWPAKIIEPLEGVAVREGHFRVYFFGTHQTAYVSETRMWPYLEMKSKFINEKSKRHKGFNNAISEIEIIMKEYAETHKNANDSSSTMPLTNGESDSSSDNNADYPEISSPSKKSSCLNKGESKENSNNIIIQIVQQNIVYINTTAKTKIKKHSKSQTTNAESAISDESSVEENDNDSVASTESNVSNHDDINMSEEEEEEEEEERLSEPELSDDHVTSPLQNSLNNCAILSKEAVELEHEMSSKKTLRSRKLSRRYSTTSSHNADILHNLDLDESDNEEAIDLDLLNRLVHECYSTTPVVRLDRIPFDSLPAKPTHKHKRKVHNSDYCAQHRKRRKSQNIDDSDFSTQHRKRRHSLSEKQTPLPKRRRHSTHSAHASYPELLNYSSSAKPNTTLHIHIGSQVYKEVELEKETEVDREADIRNRLISECYTRIPVVKLYKIPLPETKRPRNTRNRTHGGRRRHPSRSSRVASNLKLQNPLSNVEPELRKESYSNISDRLRSECLSKHNPYVRINVMSNELIARLTSQPPPKQRIGILGSAVIGVNVIELLLLSGFPISVWNKHNSEVQNAPKSMSVSRSISQIMMDCDTVVCCLTDTKDVMKTIYEHKVLELIEGKRFINCTITDPEVSLNLNEEIETRGGYYFECPLLPSKNKESKRMLGLVSGDKDIICGSSCLHAICEDMFYLGEIPYANKMACVISSFSGTAFVAIAEGLAFAHRLNINVEMMMDVLQKSQFGAQLLLERGEAFFHGEYNAKMFLKSISKDLLLSLFSTSEIPMPVTAAARQVYLHTEKYNGTSDICAIREYFVQKLQKNMFNLTEEKGEESANVVQPES